MRFRSGDGKYNVAWYAPAAPSTGYGTSGENMVRALEASGKASVHLPGTDGFDKCGVGIAYGPAHVKLLEELKTPYRILFTMFEADRWPIGWVNAANCANQVWVPSEFCKHSLEQSGCQSPVFVIPLGVNPADFYPPKKRKAHKGYVFGFAGAASLRKGFDLACRAFIEEFSKDEDVSLSIRSSALLTASVPKDKRISLSMGTVSTEDMRRFYQGIDCLLVPSRAEGFGLCGLESMACGTPVILTAWGGLLDYAADDTLQVGIDGLESAAAYHECKGSWANPSMRSLRYCMRWVHENKAEAAEMGRRASERARTAFSYGRTAERIIEVLSSLDPSERIEVERQQVVVWKGNPGRVGTAIGQFVRGIPRPLTDDQIARLNPSDIGEHGFSIEERFVRVDRPA
jgi:glycosyltransferase involved in cell wall biosynthesis